MLNWTRSGGEIARAIPNERGRIAPVAPCNIRPATIQARSLASALMTDPARPTSRTTSSARFRPYMSPSRLPSTAAAAETRA
jgi:hypothetical protein